MRLRFAVALTGILSALAASALFSAANKAHADEPDYATLAKLPWGGRIGDYQFIYGDELKQLLADKIVVLDPDKPNAKTPHIVGQVYCADGRSRAIGGINVESPQFGTYFLGFYEICIRRTPEPVIGPDGQPVPGAMSPGDFCWSMLSSEHGKYISLPTSQDGVSKFILLEDGSKYCRTARK